MTQDINRSICLRKIAPAPVERRSAGKAPCRVFGSKAPRGFNVDPNIPAQQGTADRERAANA